MCSAPRGRVNVRLVGARSDRDAFTFGDAAGEVRIKVGSDPECDWPVDGLGIQPQHVALYWDEEDLWVSCVDEHKVSVNDELVTDWRRIEAGSTVSFGLASLEIQSADVESFEEQRTMLVDSRVVVPMEIQGDVSDDFATKNDEKTVIFPEQGAVAEFDTESTVILSGPAIDWPDDAQSPTPTPSAQADGPFVRPPDEDVFSEPPRTPDVFDWRPEAKHKRWLMIAAAALVALGVLGALKNVRDRKVAGANEVARLKIERERSLALSNKDQAAWAKRQKVDRQRLDAGVEDYRRQLEARLQVLRDERVGEGVDEDALAAELQAELSKEKLKLERSAADALFTNKHWAALQQYTILTSLYPKETMYNRVIDVVEGKLRCREGAYPNGEVCK